MSKPYSPMSLTNSMLQSVVGGANLMFGPDMSILLGAAKILSIDGKSKMWDSTLR